MSKILIALAVVAAVLVLSEAAVVPPALQYAIESRDGDNCKCMPWRVCDGRINDAVNCHQSYIMVCCIITPEEVATNENAKIIPLEIEQH